MFLNNYSIRYFIIAPQQTALYRFSAAFYCHALSDVLCLKYANFSSFYFGTVKK